MTREFLVLLVLGLALILVGIVVLLSGDRGALWIAFVVIGIASAVAAVLRRDNPPSV